MKWYVYNLINPINNKIFYVGKGQKYRMYAHESCVKTGRIPNNNYRLYDMIKSIRDAGNKIIYEQVYFTDNEDSAYDYEERLVDEIGLENLCNLVPGGHNKTYSGEKHWNWGNHWSDNVKKKIGKSKLGHSHTEETKQKIRESLLGEKNVRYGTTHTDETKSKMSKNHQDFTGKNNPFYGKAHTDATREKLRKRFAKKWAVTTSTGIEIELTGKVEVLEYVSKYNMENNTKISGHSLFTYGKNGHGWSIKKKEE